MGGLLLGVSRVATGFDPLSLSPALWFKADAITGLVDADAIDTWPDSSGNARNLTPLNNAYRPTWETGEKNGLPVARFDGTNDHLVTAAFTLNQPATYFFVVKMLASGGYRTLADGNTVNSVTHWNSNGGAKWQQYAGAFGAQQTVDTTNYFIVTSVVNGASSEMYVNGGAAATGNAGANNAAGFALGGRALGENAQMDVGEVLVFPSALGSTDRAAVRDYLNARWAVY